MRESALYSPRAARLRAGNTSTPIRPPVRLPRCFAGELFTRGRRPARTSRDKMAELNTPPASEREALAGLTAALGRRFYSILRVDPARDTVLILQSRDYPQAVQTQMDWGTYLERYGGIVTPQGRERLQKRLSGPALLAAAANGEHSFSLEVPYLKGRRTNWLTIHAALDRQAGGELYADIFVRQSNDEHLLHSIIDMCTTAATTSSCSTYIITAI